MLALAPAPATGFDVAPLRVRKMLPVSGAPTLTTAAVQASPLSLSLDVRQERAPDSLDAEVIDDVVWGRVLVHEPELIALLRHEAVQRLHTVLQHGTSLRPQIPLTVQASPACSA